MTLYAPAAPVVLTLVSPPVLPEPVLHLIGGWSPGPGDTPMRMYHDNRRADWGYAPRTLRLKIAISNEITRTCPPNKAGTRVYEDAKIEIPMRRRRDGLDWIRYTHGDWATERIYRPGYGYFDGGGENPDPFTPANVFKLLFGGGQLVNARYTEGRWAFVEAQSYQAGPDYSRTYADAPNLVLKQINVGNRPDKSMFLQVDKGEVGGVGDVYLPHCSDVFYPWVSAEPMAAIELEFLEPFPSLPFMCHLYGREAMVTEYRFIGSDTWGYVEFGDLPRGWYCLERMRITGIESDRTKGGNDADREVLVTPWLHSCPIPVIDWTRQG